MSKTPFFARQGESLKPAPRMIRAEQNQKRA
jgi:hypothetical protein